jgi:outer membrane protein OmpA-like peptidoglycan-associated protein
MKFIFILVIGFSLCSLALFSQNKTFTLSLYYKINEVQSQSNFDRIDSLYKTFNKITYKINLYGYADFLNTDSYNKNLSQNRADAVKDHLLKKQNAHLRVLVCVGKGETDSKDNQSPEGEPGQRRVDVCVMEENTIKKIGNRDNKIQEAKEKAPPKKGIEELEKGESLAIEGLNFIPGRHVLVESAGPVLEKLLTTLKEHSNLKIEIQGHICCIDGEIDGMDFDTGDLKLSENRAKAIYDYLVKNGIDPERLTYKGYGHRRPKIPFERTPEEEQINRRVEIKVLENK